MVPFCSQASLFHPILGEPRLALRLSSGGAPVGQSMPEILDGYVSTIAEPLKVFKCNPPSTCPSKIFFLGMAFFFGRVGLLFKSSLVDFLRLFRPRRHEL